jgi:murein DD-endopeptidase
LAVLATTALAAACSSTPPRAPVATAEPVAASPPAASPVPVPAGQEAAHLALALLGTPYRSGGTDPQGFDCSGLVRYVFAAAGIALPRTAEEQQAATEPVEPTALEPGDLVFFRLPDPHVGIYVGDGTFVHAPGAGRAVVAARLAEPWFILAFAGAGRVSRGH